MPLWISDQARLLALILGCAVLWCAESLIPLYRYERHRLRRVLPNLGLTAILIITNLVLSFAIGMTASFTSEKRFGVLFMVNLSPWLLTILGVIALDGFAYFGHLLLHKSWLGWQFHLVHHSDNEVNVTTAFRQHPGETIWRTLWYIFAIATFGIPLWVVVVYLAISTLNAQSEHANIKLNEPLDRLLRLVFVTPNMHKVHHSREQIETDTNYSNIFSLWDRIFGTYTSTIDFQRLRYGLDGFDDRRKQTLLALLRTPFASEAKY
jgi:sterol desaturase/sphingolipid hydroxylase (fatty acid hydroxylase superfamily)